MNPSDMLVVDLDRWRRIVRGVLQRMRLLEGVMADLYGPQRLLAANLLPPALVQGHPGYLRSMRSIPPAGGRFLHLAAFDLGRDAEGHWWVVSQRTQSLPSSALPGGFDNSGIRQLADALLGSSVTRHASAAIQLGLPLVQGRELSVRGEQLYRQTPQGLVPVRGLLRQVDDNDLDPLELRADSQLGVPGLMQAVRAGNLRVVNVPGSALLESPGLLGFLPAVAGHLLGETLSLPSVATWWCGERAALEAALPQLADCVIRPSYGRRMEWTDGATATSWATPGPAGGAMNEAVNEAVNEAEDGAVPAAVIGRALSPEALLGWRERIMQNPDDYTLQAALPPQPLLRVFALPAPALASASASASGLASAAAPAWQVISGGLVPAPF